MTLHDENFNYGGADDPGLSNAAKAVDNMRQKGNVKTSIYIQKDGVKSIEQEFAMLMLNGTEILIQECNATINELRVLFYIAKLMEYGNLFHVNQTVMAKKLKTSQSAISRTMRSLVTKKVIIIDSDGNKYINPNILIKGLPHKCAPEIRERFKKASQDGGAYPPFDEKPKESK